MRTAPFGAGISTSNPPEQHKNDNDDQDGADDADTAVSITVSVAAEAAAKSAEQENDEKDNENESKRHDFFPICMSVDPQFLRRVDDRDAHARRSTGYFDARFE